MNLHHTRVDRRPRLPLPPLRACGFAWDTQEARHIRAVLRMDIDAVYCDRPDRMVARSSEWELDPSVE